MTRSVPVVLYLAPGSRPSPFHEAFVEALSGHGHQHGRSIDLRWMFAAGVEDARKLKSLVAASIKENQPSVIVTASTPLTEAAKAATVEIPIVMTISGSPVETGLVASARRTGTNVTGATSRSHLLSRKQLEVLRKHLPGVNRIAIIWNPNNAAKKLEFEEAMKAGRDLGIQVVNEGGARNLVRRLEVTGDQSDFKDAFKAARDGGAKAVIVFGDPVTVRNREAIVAAGRDGPPAIYESSDFVEAGGLMSYGPDRRQLYRRAAALVARVLDGEKPTNIAVQAAARFKLTIDRRVWKDMARQGLL